MSARAMIVGALGFMVLVWDWVAGWGCGQERGKSLELMEAWLFGGAFNGQVSGAETAVEGLGDFQEFSGCG